MATLTENTNFFQQAGFKVNVGRKNYPNFEFFAQSVSHPSVSLPAAENATTSRIQTVPQPGDTLTFDELSVIILLDEDFNSYVEIFNWMVRMVNTNQTSAYDARITEDGVPTFCDITVSALSSHNNTSKKFIYRNAFPISLGNVDFEANSTEILTVPVGFRYTYFDIA